jgi:hypothetical protein
MIYWCKIVCSIIYRFVQRKITLFFSSTVNIYIFSSFRISLKLTFKMHVYDQFIQNKSKSICWKMFFYCFSLYKWNSERTEYVNIHSGRKKKSYLSLYKSITCTIWHYFRIFIFKLRKIIIIVDWAYGRNITSTYI